MSFNRFAEVSPTFTGHALKTAEPEAQQPRQHASYSKPHPHAAFADACRETAPRAPRWPEPRRPHPTKPYQVG